MASCKKGALEKASGRKAFGRKASGKKNVIIRGIWKKLYGKGVMKKKFSEKERCLGKKSVFKYRL